MTRPSKPKQMTRALLSLDHDYSMAVLSGLLFGAILVASTSPAWPQTVKTREDAGRILSVEKLTVKEGVVSGEVFNRSSRLLRDVQLFIRYTWLWDDEMKPGKADPGTSTYYTLQKELPAGERLPFTYNPSPPLPKVSGGHFETTVSIAGFTEVIPQTK